jgi:uncharacterized protein (TIGR02246 family)
MEPTKLIDRLVDSFNTRNAPAFASLSDDNAKFVNIFGQRMRGRDGISAGHQIVVDTPLAGTHMMGTGVDVMPLGGSVVMMHATWIRERLPEATPATLAPGTGILTFVARKSADVWTLVGAANVQNARPLGAPPLPWPILRSPGRFVGVGKNCSPSAVKYVNWGTKS